MNWLDRRGLQAEKPSFCDIYPDEPPCKSPGSDDRTPAPTDTGWRGTPGGGGGVWDAWDFAKLLQGRVRKGETSDCNAMGTFASEMARAGGGNAAIVKSFDVFINMLDGGVLNANALFSQTFGHSVIGGVLVPVYLQQDDNHQASGFLSDFQDNISGADQVHHFAAYLQLGFNTNGLIGGAAAIFRDLVNFGDQALGKVAVELGIKLRDASYTTSDFIKDIGKLCDKGWKRDAR